MSALRRRPHTGGEPARPPTIPGTAWHLRDAVEPGGGRDTTAPSGRSRRTSTSDSPPAVTDRSPSVTIMFDRRNQGTRQVRTAIAEHCAERVDPALVGDAQLVASELLTNALEHGAVGLITVGITIAGEAVDVIVTSTGDASRLADPEAWNLPEPESVSGRGLAITRAIARAVDVRRTTSRVDGRDWIEITAHLEPGTGR